MCSSMLHPIMIFCWECIMIVAKNMLSFRMNIRYQFKHISIITNGDAFVLILILISKSTLINAIVFMGMYGIQHNINAFLMNPSIMVNINSIINHLII